MRGAGRRVTRNSRSRAFSAMLKAALVVDGYEIVLGLNALQLWRWRRVSGVQGGEIVA